MVVMVVVALVGYCGVVVVLVVVTVFVRLAFVIVVGELLLSGCSVMVVVGVVVGLVVIVGYFGNGGKVMVLIVMVTNIRLAVVIRKK